MNLSHDEVKLLMSKTKRKILRSLLARRKMLSELAAELNFAMPTVKEHLEALELGKFVVRVDDGHKWKYYELTDKGKSIIDEKREVIILTLTFAIPLFLLAAGLIVGYLPENSVSMASEKSYFEEASLQAPARVEKISENAVDNESTTITYDKEQNKLTGNLLITIGSLGLIGAIGYNLNRRYGFLELFK